MELGRQEREGSEGGEGAEVSSLAVAEGLEGHTEAKGKAAAGPVKARRVDGRMVGVGVVSQDQMGHRQ